MQNTVLNSSERAELNEATKADKENQSSQRSPRTRKSQTVEVECRSCGEQREVSSAVVYDTSRWKCNNCSSKACD